MTCNNLATVPGMWVKYYKRLIGLPVVLDCQTSTLLVQPTIKLYTIHSISNVLLTYRRKIKRINSKTKVLRNAENRTRGS